jgi:hypothetical protein
MTTSKATTKATRAKAGATPRRAPAKRAVAPAKAPGQRQALPAPSEAPYAPTAWQAGSNLYDHVVPSGQRCQLKKLELPELMKAGLLDTLNGLSAIVDMDVVKVAKGLPPAAMKAMMDNAGALEKMLLLIDQIVVMCVKQPPIAPLPADGEPRVPGLIYIDDVDQSDRIDIFNTVMEGVGDLAAFREVSG